MKLRQAIEATESAQLAHDPHRADVFAEILRLAEAGVSTGTIATLTGQTTRQVLRIKNGEVVAPPPPPRVTYDTSPGRRMSLKWTAEAVLDLACRIRDEDPGVIHQALARLGQQGLIEVTMIALAAIPVDVPRSQLLGWVEELAS